MLVYQRVSYDRMLKSWTGCEELDQKWRLFAPKIRTFLWGKIGTPLESCVVLSHFEDVVEKHQPEETYYDFYISLSVMIWFLSANYSKIDGLKPPTSLWACYQQRSSRNLRLFTATVLVIYGISSVLDLEVIGIYPKIAISMRQMMTNNGIFWGTL